MTARWSILALTVGLIFGPVPGMAQVVAVTHAKILTMGAAGEIADGTVLIRDGRIAAVGGAVKIPSGARLVDAAGKTVTPGLVAADTALGLTEIGSVASTDDAATSSPVISAAFDVQYGLNSNSVMLPIARMGGVTSAISMPHLGKTTPEHVRLFAGQAAAIRTAASEHILLRARVGMVIELGQSGQAASEGGRGAEIVELVDDLNAARDFMHNSRAPGEGTLRDLDLSRADIAALIPVIRRQMPLIAVVDRTADIETILALVRRQKINLILLGAAEGWKVAADIARAHVPVIVNPNDDLPTNFDRLGATMRNAALLHAAGVEVAISTSDPTHLVNELRYNAGIAVAHGLPYSAGLAAITSVPARIFGLDREVGSLEVGKDADLVIWTGDPLEPLTQPLAVFVRGKEQPMTSRQLQLAEKYYRATVH